MCINTTVEHPAVRGALLAITLGVAAVFVTPSFTSAATCVTDTDCTAYLCDRTGDAWEDDYLIWNQVLVQPVRVMDARSSGGTPLLWKQSSSSIEKWPPMYYTACWGDGDYPSDCETVKIDTNGDDSNPTEHPNIRFNDGTTTLCDEANLDKVRFPPTGDCVSNVLYGFDVRDQHPTLGCYARSFIFQLNPATGLQARDLTACESSANPYSWVTTKVHEVPCGQVSEAYRYVEN